MLTLRSQEGHYHSLILFRLSANAESHSTTLEDKQEIFDKSTDSDEKQIYVMEASCPHMGADMSHADIEECETGLVAVCPWHRLALPSLPMPF